MSSFVCAYCTNVFTTEPFKLKCGNIICKLHLDSIEYGEEFKCLLCNNEHLYEEYADLSYKKEIMIPRYKSMLADVKSRLEFYQLIAQDPRKFIEKKYFELKENGKMRKLISEECIKTEKYVLNECCFGSNFTTEFQKFCDFLKTNQNNYSYYLYAQKLKLISIILERKIEKVKEIIEEKINKSIVLEKFFGGNLDINSNSFDLIILFDAKNHAKIINLEKLECLSKINLNHVNQYLLDLKECFNFDKNDIKSKIFLHILNRFIYENKKFDNNEKISCSTFLSFKTNDGLTRNYFIIGFQSGEISISNLDKDETVDVNLQRDDSAVCSITHFDDDFNLIIASGLKNGTVSLLKITKENLYFNKNITSQFHICSGSKLESASVLNIKIFRLENNHVKNLTVLVAFSDGIVQKYEQVNCEKFEFSLIQELKLDTFIACEFLDENLTSVGFENGTIKIFDLTSKNIRLEIKAHKDRINFLKAKHEILLSCSNDKRIKLWNIKTGSLKNELEIQDYPVEIDFF